MFEYLNELSFKELSSGRSIAYTDSHGGSKVLVFLHGMGSNQKAWAKNIYTLQKTYRCITIDSPGYGHSDPLGEEQTISKFAEVIAEFLQLLGLDKVSLVGHSMGGHISMEIALKYPELVDQLILIAPAGLEVFKPGEIELIRNYFTGELIASYSTRMIAKNFELNFFNMPDDARFMIADRHQMVKDSERYLSFCNTVSASTLAIVTYNIMSQLGQLQSPVLMLFGKNDNLIPHHIVHPDLTTEGIAKPAIGKTQDGRLVMYDRCGHFVQWEKWEEVNQEIEKQLALDIPTGLA